AGGNNTQLMGVIRSHFDHIHETLNMKKEEHVFEEVPCNCPLCLSTGKPHYYNYSFLQKRMSKDKNVACVKSAEDVSIAQLIHGLLPPKEPGNLFENLITVTSQLQGINKTLQPDENSRNTVVSLLLGTRGFRVKDQTQYGSSETGTRLGELDIKIEDERGRAVSIIEALNLDSLNTTIIDRHVLKVFNHYDCNGLKENYILVYSAAKDFGDLCRKYRDHLQQIDYASYELKGEIEEPHTDTGFNKIKVFRARHKCNESETILYHLLAEM
ncbi:MAG TPA: hypothetical protein VK469_15305, partial [Candidatus Kapabacteria bacterium]|nr:hypothetical protein [Candidatus Kapabacteria bacterium]